MPIPGDKLINLLLFNLGWFYCVLGGNVLALVYTLAAVTLHALFFVRDKREWLLIGAFSFIGICVDSALLFTGVFLSPHMIAPLWLICLWVLLSMTLCHCLSWMQDKLLILGLLSGISAPMTYWFGSRFVDISLNFSLVSGVLFCSFWAILLPLSVYAAKRCIARA